MRCGHFHPRLQTMCHVRYVDESQRVCIRSGCQRSVWLYMSSAIYGVIDCHVRRRSNVRRRSYEGRTVREHLFQVHNNSALENIHNSHLYARLRTYKVFKQEYKLEIYLTHLKDLHYIKTLTWFRISSHNCGFLNCP